MKPALGILSVVALVVLFAAGPALVQSCTPAEVAGAGAVAVDVVKIIDDICKLADGTVDAECRRAALAAQVNPAASRRRAIDAGTE